MRILLAKRFPATALRNQVLSSALTIPTGVAFDRSGARHTVRITGESLCGGSRRFNSDNVGAVDPSWVRRVTGVSASVSEPQVGGGEPAITAEEGSVPVPVKAKRKRSPRAEKSDDASLPFTPPTGANVDTFEFTGFWPTTPRALGDAREFIKTAAASPHAVLLVLGRDPAGLTAGTIVSLTLQLLGKPADKIHVHFLQRDPPILDSREKVAIERSCQEHKIGHIVVLDQDSREGAETLPSPTLIISRYHSTPAALNTTILTTHGLRPIAPTALLAYAICCTLHPTAPDATALPALLGALDSHIMTLEMLRSPPVSTFLNTARALKKHTITWISKLTSMLSAARRAPITAGGDAGRAAWNLLQFDPHADPTEWPTPKRIMSDTWGSQQLRDTVARLTAMQENSRTELDRLKRIPPRYSSDKKIAVIEVDSRWQVHTPLMARWVRFLGGKEMLGSDLPKLLAVVVANRGYARGEVSFSVRRTPYATHMSVDLIALLKGYADALPNETRKEMGKDFVRWSKEAVGGSLETEIWNKYRKDGMKIQAGAGGTRWGASRGGWDALDGWAGLHGLDDLRGMGGLEVKGGVTVGTASVEGQKDMLDRFEWVEKKGAKTILGSEAGAVAATGVVE